MRASQYLLNVKCPYCANGVSEQKCLSTNSVMKCGTCKKHFGHLCVMVLLQQQLWKV